MRQKTAITKLLQRVTEVYFKVRQVLPSVTSLYYKVHQVLQSVTKVYCKVRQVLQSVTDCYYKVRQLLQSDTSTENTHVESITMIGTRNIKYYTYNILYHPRNAKIARTYICYISRNPKYP